MTWQTHLTSSVEANTGVGKYILGMKIALERVFSKKIRKFALKMWPHNFGYHESFSILGTKTDPGMFNDSMSTVLHVKN